MAGQPKLSKKTVQFLIGVLIGIILSKLINDFNENYVNPEIIDEFKFLIKILIIVGIPSILTFIEPDTGAVIMYIIITFVMLFIGGLRKRWFIFTIAFLAIFLGIFLGIYYLNQDLFINLFGTSFFYRMDRITNWSSSSGLQLRNSLIAIGSSGLTGHGINFIPLPDGLSGGVTTPHISYPALYKLSKDSLAISGVPIKRILI